MMPLPSFAMTSSFMHLADQATARPHSNADVAAQARPHVPAKRDILKRIVYM